MTNNVTQNSSQPINNPIGSQSPSVESPPSKKSPVDQRVSQQTDAIPHQETTERKLTGSPPPASETTSKTDQVVKTQMISEETEIHEIEIHLFSIRQGNSENIPETLVRILDGIVRNNEKDPDNVAIFSRFADEFVALTKNNHEAKEIQTAVKIAKQIIAAKVATDATSFNELLQRLSNGLEITPSDIEREASLLARKEGGEKNLLLANLKMVKRALLLASAERSLDKGSRVVQAEKTGYPLSVVVTCEKIFSRLVQQKKLDQAKPQIVEGHVIIPGYSKGKAVILVEELLLGIGSFKISNKAANYLDGSGTSTYVTKRPKDRHLPPPRPIKPTAAVPEPPPPSPPSPSGISHSSTGVNPPSVIINSEPPTVIIKDDKDEAEAGTFIEKKMSAETASVGGNNASAEAGNVDIKEDGETEAGTFIVKKMGTETASVGGDDDSAETGNVDIKGDNEENNPGTQYFSFPAPPEEESYYSFVNPSRLAEEIPVTFARSISSTPHVPDKRHVSDEERELREMYEKEIRLQETLQGPGIEPVHMIVETVTGQMVIVSPEAGYDIPSPQVDPARKHVVDLEGYCKALPLPISKQSKEDRLQVLHMLQDALKGLDHMHNQGYVHKDIKTQNALINPDGSLVLTDFGLTRHQSDPDVSATEGTPHCMAPETCAQDKTTTKSDIWSFGVMAYRVTHGEEWNKGLSKLVPNPKMVPPEFLLQKIGELYVDPDKKSAYEAAYPEPKDENSIEHLIWSAMRLDPDERPTAKELISMLEKIIVTEENTKV